MKSLLILLVTTFSVLVNSEFVINDNDIPELAYLDTSVNPCDNFYQFSCGNFPNIHPLPDGSISSDEFSLLEDELMLVGKEILSSEKTEEDPISLRKVKSAYQACVNTNYADGVGLTIPELRIIDEWGGMPLINSSGSATFSWNDIGKMVAQFGIPLLFDYVVYPQFDNADGFFVVIMPDTLTNPSLVRPNFKKSYDQVLEEEFGELARGFEFRQLQGEEPQPFDVFLKTVARRLLSQRNPWKSDEELDQDLGEVATFMRQLYAGGIIEDDVEILPMPNPYPSLKDLQNWTRDQFGGDINLDWVEYFGNIFGLAGVDVDETFITFPSSVSRLYGVLNLVRQTDPKVVKNFAMLRVFLFLAPDSDGPTRQAFEDYYKAKNYVLYPRWEYCTRKILDATDTASVSFAVAYDYQRYYFNINKLSLAAQMVANVQTSFIEILNEANWMDSLSREAALRKASKVLVLLGFPDFVDEKDKLDSFYRNIRICGWDNYGNSQKMRAFKQAYLFSQLAKPRTRTFWDKSTFDANAYYNRGNNKIVLPVAMLNPVFFRGDNNILDYSKIGSIIGHEITHGFDGTGQKYNEDGVQIPWWSTETLEAFTERTKCFQEQYNQYYIPEIDAYVNGTMSLDENLADNGGVRGAYRAFKKYVKDNEIKTNSKYTLEQLFFIGYGTMWCIDETEQYLQKLVQSSYAPSRYRVNGPLANLQEFSEAFRCPTGSPMNPENKCVLW